VPGCVAAMAKYAEADYVAEIGLVSSWSALCSPAFARATILFAVISVIGSSTSHSVSMPCSGRFWPAKLHPANSDDIGDFSFQRLA
jgi:hypothetical protein